MANTVRQTALWPVLTDVLSLPLCTVPANEPKTSEHRTFKKMITMESNTGVYKMERGKAFTVPHFALRV